jgi:hypothetical protein
MWVPRVTLPGETSVVREKGETMTACERERPAVQYGSSAREVFVPLPLWAFVLKILGHLFSTVNRNNFYTLFHSYRPLINSVDELCISSAIAFVTITDPLRVLVNYY